MIKLKKEAAPEAIERIQGRVVYVFFVMIVLHLTYPYSLQGELQNAIYLSFYIALLGSGVYLASINRVRTITAASLATLNLAIGIPWVIAGGNVLWLTLASYSLLIAFQATIIVVLVEYIFVIRRVGRDMVYSACTIYIILGNLFSALYMIIHALDPEAFVSSTIEVPISWQYMVYFSYSTLTTLGYGDITPVSPWAQSIVAIEAMLGLLYIAIILGRMASDYGAGEDSKSESNNATPQT